MHGWSDRIYVCYLQLARLLCVRHMSLFLVLACNYKLSSLIRGPIIIIIVTETLQSIYVDLFLDSTVEVRLSLKESRI